MAVNGPKFTSDWSSVSWYPVYTDPMVQIYRIDASPPHAAVLRGTFKPSVTPLWVAMREDTMGFLYCDYSDAASIVTAVSTDGGRTWV